MYKKIKEEPEPQKTSVIKEGPCLMYKVSDGRELQEWRKVR